MAKKAPNRAARLPKEVAVQRRSAAAEDKKATDRRGPRPAKAAAFTDYFVICTGQNPRQVHAIADAVQEALKGSRCEPAHVEGYAAPSGYSSITSTSSSTSSPRTRGEFYGLERLWGEAPTWIEPDLDGRRFARSRRPSRRAEELRAAALAERA